MLPLLEAILSKVKGDKDSGLENKALAFRELSFDAEKR